MARGLLGGPCFSPDMVHRPLRTLVYVDGFNLYYGSLKRTGWKWLDLVALCDSVLAAHHDILAVKYFTARVSPTANDPSKPQRQQLYLRAASSPIPSPARTSGSRLPGSVRLIPPDGGPAGAKRTCVAYPVGSGSPSPMQAVAETPTFSRQADKLFREEEKREPIDHLGRNPLAATRFQAGAASPSFATRWPTGCFSFELLCTSDAGRLSDNQCRACGGRCIGTRWQGKGSLRTRDSVPDISRYEEIVNYDHQLRI